MGETTEEKKRKLIYDRESNLSRELKEIFLEENSKDYIPIKTNDGFRLDWKIIGEEYKIYFDYSYLDKIDNKIYPIQPKDLSFEQWIKVIPLVQKWLFWVSNKLFYPTRIIGSSNSTDRVLLKIAVSMLDKTGLPKQYTTNIFDNMITCYYVRKRVYNVFFYRYILEIPF